MSSEWPKRYIIKSEDVLASFMPVVHLRCPKCAGELDFEDSREFGYCQYCGAKVMIEKSPQVNNYNSDSITVNNYAPGSVRGRYTCTISKTRSRNQPIRGFLVTVDGIERGKVKTGVSVSMELTEGDHRIRIQCGPAIPFDSEVRVTSDMELETGIKGYFSRKTVFLRAVQ